MPKKTEKPKFILPEGITERKKVPDVNVLGEAGGTLQPVCAGLVYNPDTITMRTYLEMEDDAQVKAVLTLIKAPLMKVVWSITCEDPDIARFCKLALEGEWLSFITDMSNALNFGHQPFEKVWKQDGKYWTYDKFLDLYPGSVTYSKDDRGNFTGLEQYTTKLGNVKIPAEKCFVFTNEKRWGNPYGRSKLRSAYMYWYIDKFTYDFENRYFERYADPMLWGQAPSGKIQTAGTDKSGQVDNISHLLDVLKAARNSGAIVTPSDLDPVTRAPKWRIELIEAQRRGADYRSRHEYLDLMKARAIFAPELVFSAPYAGSSYALAREHAQIFMSAEEAILQGVKEHIDKYVLPQLVEYNFGSKAPKASWDFESIAPETRTMLRDLVMAMVAGDIIRPDPDWISKTIGIKLREEPSKTQQREITKAVQEKLLKGIKEQVEAPPEEVTPVEKTAEGPSGQAEKIMEILGRVKQAQQMAAAARTPTAPGLPAPEEQIPPGPEEGLSRTQAAYKRWATTPTSERFRTPRAWEKAYSKGLFEDIQNHYLFGSTRKLIFDEELGLFKKSELIKHQNAVWKIFRKIFK